MTILTVILIVAAAIVIVFATYVAVARYETQRLMSYREWSDRFFNLSSKMLEADPPSEWIDVIDSINGMITNKYAAHGLYLVYRDLAKMAVKNGDVLSPDEIQFMKKNPDVAELFVAATRAGLLAFTFAAPLGYGVRIRALMAEAWVRIKQPSTAVSEFEKVRKAFRPRVVHSAAA